MASKAWDRREDESAQAYEAFTVYLTQPAAERSLRDAAKELSKSASIVLRWSATHDWQDRARSFDAENERKRIAAEQKRHADRVDSMRRRHRRAGKLAVELAVAAFVKHRENATLADAVRLLKVGIEAEQAGFESLMPGSVATSGDLTDPMKQGLTHPAAQQPVTQLLRKLEIEVIGDGGKIVPASEIAAAMVKFYDPVDETPK